MHEWTDDQLLELLRSAQPAERNRGLTALYQNLYGGVARFVLNNSGTEEDAKDIFQEGLIVLYEKVSVPDFVQTSSLKTFLHAICRNLWLKRLRRSSRRETSVGEIQLLPIADWEDAHREDQQEEQKELVQQLLGQLGESCRRLLVRFYYERRSMQEIANLLGLSNDRVAKNKKARCMNKLRELHGQLRKPQGKTSE